MPTQNIPLRFAPGVFGNGTAYQGRGRWITADMVRWIEGTMRPIGGWVPLQVLVDGMPGPGATIGGVPRGMEAWRGNDGTPWLAIGSTTQLQAYSDGLLFNISPLDLVPGVADAAPFSNAGTYGFGLYGVGLYGVGTAATALSTPDTWSMDVFGDALVASLTSDGRVLVWNRDTALRAAPAAGAPIDVRGVVVTPERFLMALGTTGDVRTVSWASQESTTDWTPTALNTAGSYPLTTNGKLMCARRGRQQTLFWTDTDLHAATYIGGSLVYSFSLLGENCGIVAPNAVATSNGVPFWMGTRGFWMYDGFVKEVPCEVADYVFGRLNAAQQGKVYAVALPNFAELWWFYPSNSSSEIDSYVVYNVRENHWATGSMGRTAAVQQGTFAFPIMADRFGNVYEHERGTFRGSVKPWAESGPVQLGEGDQLMTVMRVLPDERNLGDVRATLLSRLYPTSPELASAPLSVRHPTDARITGRQIRLRLQEGVETDWRVGEFRVSVAARGKR